MPVYIATVWFSDPQTGLPEKPKVITLQARDVEDFQQQVRQAWPGKGISFGPVSLSKDHP